MRQGILFDVELDSDRGPYTFAVTMFPNESEVEFSLINRVNNTRESVLLLQESVRLSEIEDLADMFTTVLKVIGDSGERVTKAVSELVAKAEEAQIRREAAQHGLSVPEQTMEGALSLQDAKHHSPEKQRSSRLRRTISR